MAAAHPRLRGARPARTARMAPLVVALALAAACGSNRYDYVTNDAEGTFLKVPSAWETFSLTAADDEGRPESQPSGIERIWHVGFDAADRPDTAHLSEAAPASLVGEISTYSLSVSNTQQMSLSGLRSAVLGFDPLLQDPGLPPQWELVAAAPITGPAGSQGTRVVVNVPNAGSDGEWITIDVSTLFDPNANRAHVLSLHCEASCYQRYRGTADLVATSWKVTK